MSDKNVLIEVKDLCKSFGDVKVLNGISTEIAQGEVVAIIGPSGCGKSTFLRSLNLLEEPTSGVITFEGTDITDKSVDINKMRQKIGMVFQQFNLFPNYTVKENIMLAPVQTGLMNKEGASKRADELLKRVGLFDKYKESNPDLVFLDIVMPKKDGNAAIREIMEFDSEANIIIASSVGTQSQLKLALEAGAKDFIQKPLDKDQVVKVVSKFLEGR